MKYSEAKPGRIFVIRLEDGEIVHEVIEAFAAPPPSPFSAAPTRAANL
jgi:predicted DNA-binding protein with PD1-like motif